MIHCFSLSKHQKWGLVFSSFSELVSILFWNVSKQMNLVNFCHVSVRFNFSLYNPLFQKRQENFEACWSVKKILNHSRASRTFAWLLQYKPRFTFCEIECYFLKMTLFQNFRWHESFYFSFLVQRYKSDKKILKPAGASRKFWTILERQELLHDFYSINQDLYFVILNVNSSKWLFSRL